MRQALILFIMSGLVARAAAQAPAPAPAAPPSPAQPATRQEKKPETVRERERTIYVPFDELEKVFTDGGKGVFLPYKEFLELWNELTLKRKADEEVKPPQDGVVSRADYTARVEGETLVMDAVVTVESFKKGWLTVPVAKGGVIPGIAEADAGRAVLKADADGYDVLLPEKGRYEIKLRIHVPVKKTAGKQSVSLALPQAAVSRFTATVPGTGWDFIVQPAAAFTSRGVGADTELSFFFGSGGKFDVTWGRPESATDLKPLVLASSNIVTEVRGGSLATRASVDFRILRAPVPGFTFLIPAGQEVMGVTGDDVKDWKLEVMGDKQKLTVAPNAPVKEKWSLVLLLEAPLPKLPAEVPVPEIIVEGASQDRGEMGIAAESELDVTPKPGGGLVQQTQMAAPAQGMAAIGGYRFLRRPATLTLGVAEAKPQVDVDSLTVLTVKRESIRVEAVFNYHVRRVGVFEARVALPAGWSGWEVAGQPAENWSVEKAGAGEVLAVRFNKQTIGDVSFAVRAQQQRANPTDDAVAPVFAPQGVLRHDAKIGIGVHSSLEVNTKTAGDLRPDDVNAIGSVLQLGGANTYSGATWINSGLLKVQQDSKDAARGAGPADTELTLAFRHRGDVKTPATLSFKARDPQVNVEVLTLVEAREQSLRHTWTLAFDIAYAGINKFVLAVPKAVAGDIRFVDPGVNQINKDHKPDAALLKNLPDVASYTIWEVGLRNERTGSFEMSLSVETPLPPGKEAKLELLQVHVPGVFQETGQVAVVKDDNLEIRKYDAGGLEEIDPKELRGSLRRDGVFVALKWRALPVKLALDMAKNAYIEVPAAVITHAGLATAVATDLAQTTETIYWVKNNAQQFLTVRLPKGARLLSDFFVNGATQQPMKREGSEDLLVRLPAGAVKQAVPIRFVFEVPSPKAGEKMGWWGRFSVEPPEALDNHGRAVLVLEAHDTLYLPEGWHYTKFEGPMSQAVEDNGWRAAGNIASALIPAFGPQLGWAKAAWTEPPQIPAQQAASFDFKLPTPGQKVKLHRLGAPAVVEVTHRLEKISFLYEAAAFFVVAMMGLARTRRPLPRKVIFVAVIGLAALLSTGLLSATNGRIARAVLMALALVVVLWTALGIFTCLRGLGARLAPRGGSEAPPGGDGVPSPSSHSGRQAERPPDPERFPRSGAFTIWTEANPAPNPPAADLEFPRLDAGGESK